MVLPFVYPALLILLVAGPEGAKNLSGGNVLRLIQIRLRTPSLQRILPACQDNSPQIANPGFEFHKRSQLFIGAHDEALSVIAMRVSSPNRSPVGINR
jgi:hypothetical protein